MAGSAWELTATAALGAVFDVESEAVLGGVAALGGSFGAGMARDVPLGAPLDARLDRGGLRARSAALRCASSRAC